MANLRSAQWWNNPDNPGMTALYLERHLNFGLTPEELHSSRPIIGIAQSANDLAPCNRIHYQTVERLRDGIREAGGIPLVFPMHPLQESIRRPTAALDRNLAYLGLVEILHGYPLDGVVFTTGCDKTTPAALMAAATTDLPSLIFNGGPMVNSYLDGERAGAGTIIWECRRRRAAGEIDDDEFLDLLSESAPSPGHCNVMGTALSMNSLAEALGMAMPGTAAIPAVFRARNQAAYRTGKRIVEMVREDLRPSAVLSPAAFHNAIRVNTAIGGSSNCPPHVMAIAKHAGVELSIDEWETLGYELPLLADIQPAGAFLAEEFYHAGGVPTIMRTLLEEGVLSGEAMTVTGRSVSENLENAAPADGTVIRAFSKPVKQAAGFLVMRGNLFDSAIMKTSVISEEFRTRYLEAEDSPNRFECEAVVFEGPEDYHDRINDPQLNITESSLLIIRGCGPVGFPGSGEVVNMLPPDALIQKGVNQLPVLGDGRQSGTSASPSFLNASPEAYAGGGMSKLMTGDRVRIDLNERSVEALVPPEEWSRRGSQMAPLPDPATPWQQIYRDQIGQLQDGACFEKACSFRNICATTPRHNH